MCLHLFELDTVRPQVPVPVVILLYDTALLEPLKHLTDLLPVLTACEPPCSCDERHGLFFWQEVPCKHAISTLAANFNTNTSHSIL